MLLLQTLKRAFDTLSRISLVQIRCCVCCSLLAVVVVVVVVVLTLFSHCYNAVRGHRAGSSNSVAEEYLRRKTTKKRR